MESVLPRLPETLRVFAGQPDAMGHVSLHDGRVEWWACDDDRSFTLQLFCGNLQLGYRRLVIQYCGRVELFGAPKRDVANWLDDAGSSIASCCGRGASHLVKENARRLGGEAATSRARALPADRGAGA
jgi:hypothetical protein